MLPPSEPGSQQLFRYKRPTSSPRFCIEVRHRNIADMLSNVKLKILKKQRGMRIHIIILAKIQVTVYLFFLFFSQIWYSNKGINLSGAAVRVIKKYFKDVQTPRVASL